MGKSDKFPVYHEQVRTVVDQPTCTCCGKSVPSVVHMGYGRESDGSYDSDTLVQICTTCLVDALCATLNEEQTKALRTLMSAMATPANPLLVHDTVQGSRTSGRK